jgi:plastocyanin
MQLRALAVTLVAAVLAVSCSSGGSDRAEPAEFRNVVDMRSRATGSYPEVHVAVKDNDFVAPAIRINPGTTVSWKNEGRSPHDILPADTSQDFGKEFGF